MGRPKGESEEDKKARLRERRITEVNRTQQAEKTASGLTTDLRAIYGLRNMFRMT